jgi:beta-glucanase (GH16 family)
MKNVFLILLFALFQLVITYAFSQTIITRPGIGDCELVFEDNFDSTALNINKWNYRTDSKHWSTQLPENVSMHDGYLYLNVEKKTVGTMNYTGAGVISKAGFRYGYYESRFKIPTGTGWHTSFWMMGFDGAGGSGTKNAYQEIDVCENDSKNQTGYSTNLHNWLGTHTYVGAKNVSTPNLSAEFHTWGCEFTPSVINFYFEGQLVRTVDASTQKHNDSNIWLTTIASYLGSTTAVDDTKLPSAAIFDYVRYYKLLNPVYPPVNPPDTTTVTPNMANPIIIVDNTDARCTFDSPWTSSAYTAGFQGSNYLTDGTATADSLKWAKWTPDIPIDGNYSIFMKWTAGTNRPTAAPIEIQHGEGTTTSKVDQTKNNGVWCFLGKYLLLKGTGNYVKIFANTIGYTIADAVLFEQKTLTGVDSQKTDNNLFHVVSNASKAEINAIFEVQSPSKITLSVYNASGLLINKVLNESSVQAGKQIYSLSNSSMKQGLYIAVLSVNGLLVGSHKFIF